MEQQLPGLYMKMTLADATLSMVGDVVASYSVVESFVLRIAEVLKVWS